MPGETRSHGDIAFALGLTLALRVFYSCAAAAMVRFVSIDPALARSNQLIDELPRHSSALAAAAFGPWERFDSLWYLHIANSGYDRPAAAVFYPLYPALIRSLTYLVGSPIHAALLISTVATFFLFLGIMKLARLDVGVAEARSAALVCAVSPAAFILMAGYPEALVAALTVWAVVAARARRWPWAAAAGFAAGLAKAVGFLSVVPLLLLALPEFRRHKRALLFASVPILAPAAVNYWVTGALRGPAPVYQEYWRTQVAFPWTTLAASVRRAVEGPDALVALNLGALLLVVLVVLTLPTRREHTLYALAAVLFFLVKKTDPLLQSTLRYTLCIFPVSLSLARALESRWLVWVVALPLAGLNLILLWHFVHWSLVV